MGVRQLGAARQQLIEEWAPPLDEQHQLLQGLSKRLGLIDHNATVEERLELSQPEVDRSHLVEDVLGEEDRIPDTFERPGTGPTAASQPGA